MRKHDARMIIQRIVAGAFRGTRKAFKAKKLETKRKDHPQHHLYWCKREPIKGKKEAFLAYYRILNGYRKDGWEVEEIRG